MKKALITFSLCCLVIFSVKTFSNESNANQGGKSQRLPELILEKEINLHAAHSVLATYWFKGEYQRSGSKKTTNSLALQAIELQARCEQSYDCDSTLGLYQAFSDSFATYQNLVGSLPNIHFNSNDKYCPLGRCSFSEAYHQQKQLHNLDNVLKDWQFTAKIMSASINQSYQDDQPIFIYIRFLGKNKHELTESIVN